MVLANLLCTLIAAYIGNYIGRYITVNNGTYRGRDPFAFRNMNHFVNIFIAFLVCALTGGL